MLARIRKSMEEKEQGFTLIELLVVIIIIGILAAIAIPVFLNQRKKATEASVKSDVRNAATEMETYFTDNQAYPAAGTDLTGTGYDVQVSKNNTITVLTRSDGDAGAFCLKGNNSDTSIQVWYYDSKGGGLTTTTCA